MPAIRNTRTSLTLHKFLEQKYQNERRSRLRHEGVESSRVSLPVGVPASICAGVGFNRSLLRARARERQLGKRGVYRSTGGVGIEGQIHRRL